MAAPESIEAALRDKCIRDSVLNGIVKGRVYPVMVPTSGEYPCMVFRRIATERRGHMQGAAGVIRARIQSWFWSRDYDQTKAMFDAYRRIVDGFRGRVTVGSTTFDIRSAFLDGEADDFDESRYANGEDVLCTTVFLDIEHTETVVSH